MCGIAGFLNKGFNCQNTDLLVSMGNEIAHRGPDAHGEYLDDLVGLCHRRLSILDLSEAGNQPMFSPDGNIVIVFNGEIYNFPELRAALELEGITFVTGTDTEVIIHLYQKLGTDCLAQLNGMFAFAIWDKQKQELFIARDRLGKKPLYYLQHQDRFAFASEIKSLLALPEVPREIRDDAVWDFFAYQYIPDPKSIFKHIHKLPPGHYMIASEQGIQISEYWDLSFAQVSNQDESSQEQALAKIIEQSTTSRMLADVPLGAFLSGGVDSSGIVALMSKNSESPVKTCNIAFDKEAFNESEFAKIVSEKYATDHHEFLVHQNVQDNLEHIVSFFDEPFGDPSLVPTYFVSELARSAVTVAISGDGGDEVFAGYQKYNNDDLENKLREKFPQSIRTKVFPKLSQFLLNSSIHSFRRAGSLLKSLSVDPAMGFYITNSQIRDDEWQNLATEELSEKLKNYHPSESTLHFYQKADGPDHLSKILYTDIKTYMTGGILVKVDRMSMAHSLEVRAPLLDMNVLEYAATLPSDRKFKDGEKKYILKNIFKKLLPDEILYRKKMGFNVPLADWFRNEIKPIAERYLLEESVGLQQYFKKTTIEQFWQEHQALKADHSTKLWSLLMFEMWYQRYMLDA
ncbi:asparagine synthase (glutamine-hydrolyzing) [Glaciecola sp. 1036]|uniref:asparagine synthase (glutamine-hydrolyzing) n=1 Tax=Alteromonadaceae TaxID=72275 RepID=UPI003D06E36F